MNGSFDDREVLIVTDPQLDFCPGGALAVPEGDAIVPAVNRLARRFSHVILTQDWHPAGHASDAGRTESQRCRCHFRPLGEEADGAWFCHLVIEEQGKHSLRARVGAGGGRVEVHTISGEIRVRAS